MRKTYLKEFMSSIPIGEYKKIKDEIIERCHITDDIWKNWLSGRTAIPELARPIINEIAGYDIFNEEKAAQMEQGLNERYSF